MIASGRSTMCEMARFIDIDTDVEIDNSSKAEKEVGKERTCGSTADNGYREPSDRTALLSGDGIVAKRRIYPHRAKPLILPPDLDD